MSKRHYVIIERLHGSPGVSGYDLFIVPWTGFGEIVTAWAEDLELDAPADLRFTVVEWTRKQLDDWCEKYGVAPDDDF